MHEFTVSAEVRAGAKKRELIYDTARKTFVIRTPKPPEDGKANKDVVDMLAEHFNLPKSAISILRGATSKKKIIKIMAP